MNRSNDNGGLISKRPPVSVEHHTIFNRSSRGANEIVRREPGEWFNGNVSQNAKQGHGDADGDGNPFRAGTIRLDRQFPHPRPERSENGNRKNGKDDESQCVVGDGLFELAVQSTMQGPRHAATGAVQTGQ